MLAKLGPARRHCARSASCVDRPARQASATDEHAKAADEPELMLLTVGLARADVLAKGTSGAVKSRLMKEHGPRRSSEAATAVSLLYLSVSRPKMSSRRDSSEGCEEQSLGEQRCRRDG